MAVFAAACLVFTAGCAGTTTIIPPPAPREPAAVFVLDHGRHTTLVLPHPDGIVRYAYGDWKWYAEVETGLLRGSSAVLWPTQAALGRRLMAAPATETGVRQGVEVGIEQLHPLQVEATDAEALRKDLEALFRANLESRIENRAYHLEFVHHPDPYTAFHNSNHKVAEWLERMGCQVRGSAFRADWRVAAPAEDPVPEDPTQ